MTGEARGHAKFNTGVDGATGIGRSAGHPGGGYDSLQQLIVQPGVIAGNIPIYPAAVAARSDLERSARLCTIDIGRHSTGQLAEGGGFEAARHIAIELNERCVLIQQPQLR